ncbi:MAG: hypothetical protein ACI4HM_03705 [Ruminococcus sp.]
MKEDLKKNTFLEDCLNSKAELSDWDKYIEYWHTHNTNNSLREFLGMTVQEYERWLKYNDSFLEDILRERGKENRERVLMHRSDMEIISNYLFKILCIDNKYMTFYYQADEEKISVCDMKSSIISYIPCKFSEIEDKLSLLKKMFDGKDDLQTAIEALKNISVIERVVFQEDYTREELNPYRIYEVGRFYLVSKIKK